MQPPHPEDLIGRAVGDCELERLIARGGMALTYEGHHRALDLPVVVKLLDPRRAWGRPALVTAFLNEGRALGAVLHPHVVRVLSAGEEERIPYLVLERVPGRSLRARLRAGDLDLEARLELLHEAALGLGAAHAAGVAHGDVKPENLLVSDHGALKVIDFGLARLGDGVQGAATAVYGTPAYMSPERCRGEEPSPRSDVYALGVTLYELICDRWPFNAPEPRRLLAKHLEEEPPLEPLRAAGVGAGLVRVVARCLAKDPAARPADGNELARALREVLDGSGLGDDDPGAGGGRRKGRGRGRRGRGRGRRGPAGAGGLAVALAAAALALAALALLLAR